MLNIHKLYKDFHIPHMETGHKHCRPGWIQTKCPFCSGNPGWHLGFCFDNSSDFKGRFVCYRCGGKSTLRALSAILKINIGAAKKIAQQYGLKDTIKKAQIPRNRTKIIKPIQHPITPLYNPSDVKLASLYLKNRGFDVKELEKEWKVKATTHLPLDQRFRIIVPIFYKNKMVSYQGRDYTNKQSPKYKACPKENEGVHHKNILFGLDKVKGSSCVLVEGVFDVFKLGAGAVACFGIKHRPEQIKLLQQRFKKVSVLFDNDLQVTAQSKKQSKKICIDLAQRGIEVQEIILDKPGDPGDLSLDEARKVMYEIL